MDKIFQGFCLLLHHPNLKIPKNIRLYIIDNEHGFYINNGEVRKERLPKITHYFVT